MALTKIGKEGITGISNSANANAITIDSGENVALSGTLGVTGAITGTLATAAQTNITSVGTLTSITVGDGHTIGNQSVSDNLEIKSSSGENIVYNSHYGGHIFYNDGTETFRINDDGEARLTGTITKPSGDLTLDVAGDINIDAGGGDVNFKDDGTQYGFLSKYNNDLWIGNTISDGDVAIRGNDGGSNITALTLDMSAAGAAAFNSYITSTAVYGKGDANTGIQFDGSDVITLHTGGAERVRINSSGNVGIGVTTPSTRVHIRSSTASNIAGYRSGTTGLIVEGDAQSYIQMVATKSNPMGLLFDGGNTHNDTARGAVLYDIDTGLSFKSGGATRWTINETGNLLPSATSLGVYLGVTSATASNLLDDYEEGAWTPTFSATAAAGSVSYSSQHGRYIKIGKFCRVWIDIQISAASGMSGVAVVSLPFASAASYYDMGAFTPWAVADNFTGGKTPTGWITLNAAYIMMYTWAGDSAAGHSQWTINTTGRISGSISYTTG